MCCSCEEDQMMMLLCQSTVCLPYNPAARDARLSNQAELSPFRCTCKQKLFGCFRQKYQNECDKITGSAKLQRSKHSIFSEGSQVLNRQTCSKKAGGVIIWRDDPWLAQVHWNILQPAAVRDHQSSFKASIHTTAGYSIYIWPFAACFKNQLY